MVGGCHFGAGCRRGLCLAPEKLRLRLVTAGSRSPQHKQGLKVVWKKLSSWELPGAVCSARDGR